MSITTDNVTLFLYYPQDIEENKPIILCGVQSGNNGRLLKLEREIFDILFTAFPAEITKTSQRDSIWSDHEIKLVSLEKSKNFSPNEILAKIFPPLNPNPKRIGSPDIFMIP